MDSARLQRYSTNQQRDLNMVRIYLQVTTLAELVDPSDSFKISEWALDAHRPVHFVAHPAWPRQENLTASQRRVEEVYFLPVSSVWQILANDSTPIFEGDQREVTELDSSCYELLGGKDISTQTSETTPRICSSHGIGR
ncbi:hypothetical protein MHU86_8052 [Fragilaria crotonensis]|nr:hypothetical protein MHU86_8052 [Fragilaria crotonensis]